MFWNTCYQWHQGQPQTEPWYILLDSDFLLLSVEILTGWSEPLGCVIGYIFREVQQRENVQWSTCPPGFSGFRGQSALQKDTLLPLNCYVISTVTTAMTTRGLCKDNRRSSLPCSILWTLFNSWEPCLAVDLVGAGPLRGGLLLFSLVLGIRQVLLSKHHLFVGDILKKGKGGGSLFESWKEKEARQTQPTQTNQKVQMQSRLNLQTTRLWRFLES